MVALIILTVVAIVLATATLVWVPTGGRRPQPGQDRWRAQQVSRRERFANTIHIHLGRARPLRRGFRSAISHPPERGKRRVTAVMGCALLLGGCQVGDGVPPSENDDLTQIIVDAVTVAYGAAHDVAEPDVRLVGNSRVDLSYAVGFANAPSSLPLATGRTWDVQVFDVLSDDPEEKKLEVIVWDSDLHRQKHGDVFEVTAVRKLLKWSANATSIGTARGSVIK